MPTRAPFVVVGSRRHMRPPPIRVAAGSAGVAVLALAVVAGVVRSELPSARRPNPVLPAATWLVGEPPVQTVLSLETATTEAQRDVGLAFRPAVSPSSGMAFVMPTRRRQALDGRDLRVPLDLVYVGPDWRVSSIERLIPSSPPMPSRGRVALAIEVPAGSAVSDALVVGAPVSRMPELDQSAMPDAPVDQPAADARPVSRSLWDRLR